MKLTILLELIFITILLAACESVETIDPDLPYTELFVVSGQISHGDINPEIRFTKTLELNRIYDIKDAELKNVITYIKNDEQGIFPLEYITEGIYQPITRLEILPGGTYELFAEYDGTRMYGVTKAPANPVVVNAELVDGHIECEITPKKNESYCCVYVLVQGLNVGIPNIVKRENDFFSVEGPFAEDSKNITIRTGVVPEEYRQQMRDYTLGVEVYAWDKSYKSYFETKNNNKPIDDIFSEGGGSIAWNVAGENTIGMFIGFSTTVYLDIIK